MRGVVYPNFLDGVFRYFCLWAGPVQTERDVSSSHCDSAHAFLEQSDGVNLGYCEATRKGHSKSGAMEGVGMSLSRTTTV